jgi:Ras-related C3 botulinum toxin substrate 1
MADIENCKLVAVGDGAIGKTSLLMCFVHDTFPKEYVPTVFDNHDANVRFKDKMVRLALWDTAGQEEYDKLRYLSYPNSNVFMICFSVVSKSSYDNVKQKWLKEIQKASPSTPIILTGTKMDIRESEQSRKELEIPDSEIVTKEMGEELAKQIGAYAYIECSAFLMKNVQLVFDKALECHFHHISQDSNGDLQEKREGCCLVQ